MILPKDGGGDHSTKGQADAALFCKQHGLTREDSELVVWLVGQHLTMSRTAQTQDLSDQDAIAKFAEKIPNDRFLVALYLLTVADIRGTSPKVWNVWKGKLLENLFRATRRFMVGGKIEDQVGEIRTARASCSTSMRSDLNAMNCCGGSSTLPISCTTNRMKLPGTPVCSHTVSTPPHPS
ncbi:MAG: hypothetical protein WDM70_10045 [Nitrosomonadales bacterium]